MSISKAFNALGDQLIQEQNILKDGWTEIKDYFEDRKVKKEDGMKAMQAELLSKKLESKLSTKVQKQQPQMKM